MEYKGYGLVESGCFRKKGNRKQDERKEKSTSVFLFYLYTPMIEAQVAPALWQLKKKMLAITAVSSHTLFPPASKWPVGSEQLSSASLVDWATQ